MNKQDKVLGVAWDLTRRRACLLDAEGRLLRSYADGVGTADTGGDVPGAVAALVDKLHMDCGKIILSGVAALRHGVREAACLGPDVELARLPQHLLPLDTRFPDIACYLVPGISVSGGPGLPDMMCGEETLVYGARLLGAPDGWFVLPDTHSKWVCIERGRVADIVTFTSGELFALLTRHGCLSPFLQQAEDAPAAFDDGVLAAREHGLSHALFACRVLVLAERLPAAHAASYLYGLLVGAELAEMRRRSPRLAQGITQVIGPPELAQRHARALALLDMRSMRWPPDAVHAAALYELAGL